MFERYVPLNTREYPTPQKRTEKIKTRVDPDAAHAQMVGAAQETLGTPENPNSRIFTLANIITFSRFVLTVAFLYLFVAGQNRPLALICYAVAAGTDFLDGQVARRTQTVSWLGKIMDPLMDRVLLFVGVLGLMITGELPTWVAFFVIGRDVYLALGALILQKYRRRPVDVIFIGKLTTFLFMAGFCGLLIGMPQIPGLGIYESPNFPGFGMAPAVWSIWLVYAGVICSTITAIIYTKVGLFFTKESKAGRDVESAESNERARRALRKK